MTRVRRACTIAGDGREVAMNDAAALRTQDIGTVDDQFFTLRDFPVADGTVMPEATIVYETYVRLAPPDGPNGGRNAVLVTHAIPGVIMPPAAIRPMATSRARGTG